jgi:hypothetical protein
VPCDRVCFSGSARRCWCWLRGSPVSSGGAVSNRRMEVQLFGGETVAPEAFPHLCIAQAQGDTPMEPATWASGGVTLLFSEAVKEEGKSGQEHLGPRCTCGPCRSQKRADVFQHAGMPRTRIPSAGAGFPAPRADYEVIAGLALYMRRLSLLLFRCHGLCISVHGLWTRAVCYAEKMQDHPLCVLDHRMDSTVVP